MALPRRFVARYRSVQTQARVATARRDWLIVEARDNGATLPEIARALGVSKQWVAKQERRGRSVLDGDQLGDSGQVEHPPHDP